MERELELQIEQEEATTAAATLLACCIGCLQCSGKYLLAVTMFVHPSATIPITRDGKVSYVH